VAARRRMVGLEEPVELDEERPLDEGLPQVTDQLATRSLRPRGRGRRRRARRHGGRAQVARGQRPVEEVLALGDAGHAAGVLGEQQTPPSPPVDQDRRVIVLVLAAGCWPATQALASGSCRISTTSCRARRRSGRLDSTVPALSDNLRIGEASEDSPGRAEATVPGQGRVGPSGGVRGHHRTVPDDTADGAFEVLCWHSYFALIWGERARS
jgi:hypothetical protein